MAEVLGKKQKIAKLPGKILKSLTIPFKNMVRILVNASVKLSVRFMTEVLLDLDRGTF